MNPQISNFGKVYSKALWNRSNFLILILILILGSVFWQFFGLISFFGLVIISAKSLILASQKKFISQTLDTQPKFNISDLIKKLTTQLNKPYLEETKINFQNARREITQIQKNILLINKNNPESSEIDQLNLSKYLPEIVNKVISLSLQEQKIRRFLQTENLPKINSELENLEHRKKILLSKTYELNTEKNTEKSEIFEIIQAKKNQLETIQNCETELAQIEKYLSQIQAKLSAIRILTAKISLQNGELVEFSDNLFQKIEKLNLEISLFEEINKKS